MKKYLALILVAAMFVSVLVGCSGNNTPSGSTNSLNVCLASEPDTIDPALNSAVDGATMVIHLFSGLVKWAQGENGALELAPDCVTELPEGVVGDDGKVTYTFTLKDGLKWSDGSALTAQDFVYAWNRAVQPVTAADYGYMFDIIDRTSSFVENADGTGMYNLVDGEYVDASVEDADGNVTYNGQYDEKVELNVKASDDGKTLTVVINNACTYFYELLAFPTYMPVQQATVDANPDSWATDPATYICNGAYTISEWAHDSKIVLKKNPNYHAADTVTLDEIVFYLSDDANTMLANYKSGQWLFIDDVPTSEIKALEEQYPNEYFVEGQLGTYYVIFNVNKSLLPASSTLEGVEREEAEEDIRTALGLLIDRIYVCEEIGQAGQVPASSFVGMGLTDADGKTQFYHNAGHSDEFNGYYNVADEAYEGNVAQAIELLKKYFTYDEATGKFTDVPTVEYIYNTNDGHKAIAEYLQACYAEYGITLTITNQEWNTFLNTRKNGEYNMARNGWLADYNDPMSFLDMWVTESGNNDAQFGRDAHASLAKYSMDLTDLGIDYKVENATWAETYDYVADLILKTTDTDTRYALMHKIEDLLMETGAIMPIYYYTDIFMSSSSIEGMFTSPLGYKYFMHATVK